jgi:hypothetical protein
MHVAFLKWLCLAVYSEVDGILKEKGAVNSVFLEHTCRMALL